MYYRNTTMSKMIQAGKEMRAKAKAAGATPGIVKKTTPATGGSSAMALMMRNMRRTIGQLHLKVSELQGKMQEEPVRDKVRETMPQLAMYPVIDGRLDKPKYPGRYDVHPVTFIEDLFSYLRRLPTKEHVIDNIIGCLEGDVRRWARIYKDRWDNEEDFKADFMDTYWGESEQNQLRRNIVCGVWEKNTHKSMMGYFISLAGQAKMLSTPLMENQLVNDLMHHFPREVQYAWRMRKGESIIEATEFLRDLDDVDKQDRYVEGGSSNQTLPGMKRGMPATGKSNFGNKKPKIIANLEINEEEEQERCKDSGKNLN